MTMYNFAGHQIKTKTHIYSWCFYLQVLKIKKMERVAPRYLYCEECSLQFEKKLLFDLHISLKHRKRIQGVKKPEIYKEKSPKPQTKEKSSS